MKKLEMIKLTNISGTALNEREKLSIRGGWLDTCCACYCMGLPPNDQMGAMDNNAMNPYWQDGNPDICKWYQGPEWLIIENCYMY